jgi:flavin reductase (DIM6/NTAB) family NADH-FMN oxidoreductase RutF
MTIVPRQHDPRDVYKLMIGSIVPRPIAFVSSLSRDGILNLAPFSFFMGVCPNPPVIAFSTTLKSGEETRKDTLRNVEETGEFVVNIVNEAIAEQMNLCSGEYPPEVDEFAVSGLTPIPSDIVKPPRVAESPVQMECRLIQVIDVSLRPLGARMVLGEVVSFHVDDAIVDDFRIDPDKLRAIARMGGNTYSRTRDRFDLLRPK